MSKTSDAGLGVWAPDPEQRAEICARLDAGNQRVIAEAPTLEALLEHCRAERPGCIVVAVRRPDRELGAGIATLRSELGAIGVVLVSERVREGEARRAVADGFDGVLHRRDVDRALVPVVTAVRAGQVTVPRRHRRELGSTVLTTREKQILALVVMGLTNAQIATKLYLAESTVKSHLSSSFAKLGVSSRYEAVGLILDPERGRGLGVMTMPPDRITASGGLAPRRGTRVYRVSGGVRKRGKTSLRERPTD